MSSYFPSLKNSKYCENKPCLICMHYAGGNANVFQRYINLNKEIFVAPIELPGHGRRIKENLPTDMKEEAANIAREIVQRFYTEKLYLYGHSIGTILIYEVCRCLEESYDIFPKQLIVSGRNAPFEEEPSEFRSYMGREEMIREMKRYGFMTDDLLDNEMFLKYFTPLILSDYRLGEQYKYDGSYRISTPVSFHYGDRDVEIIQERADSWKNVTRGAFSRKVFQGNHFFMFDKDSDYFEKLFQQILKND